jgi:hypothetical protein
MRRVIFHLYESLDLTIRRNRCNGQNACIMSFAIFRFTVDLSTAIVAYGATHEHEYLAQLGDFLP